VKELFAFDSRCTSFCCLHARKFFPLNFLPVGSENETTANETWNIRCRVNSAVKRLNFFVIDKQVWYQLGNAFLGDELRGESLLDYIMHVVQMSMGGNNGRPSKDDHNEADEEQTAGQ
jgi:hypothetical protein